MANYVKKLNYSMANRTEYIPDEDTVYTIERFKEAVECGLFIDYDGVGHPVKDGKCDPDIWIKPSKLDEIPDDATEIVWYNR